MDKHEDIFHPNSNMQIQMKNFKYEAAMKCKVGPKLVKGSNVVLSYTCLNRNIQIQIYKHKYTNIQI